MSMENFIDLSIVRLTDGRRGTIVHIFPAGDAAIVEVDKTDELVEITPDDIKEIIWTP